MSRSAGFQARPAHPPWRLPDLAAADWQSDFDQLQLPPHLKKAVIVHKGELTPGYAFLKKFLAPQTAKGTAERRPGMRAP